MSALPQFVLMAGLAAVIAASGGDPRDDETVRRTEDLLLRAINHEELTLDNQRMAQQMLRDWRLSEQSYPSNDVRTENMLLALAEGRPLPPELLEKAEELHRDYFTPEGRERLRASSYTYSRSGGLMPLSSQAETSKGDWFMFGISIVILIGGVAISAIAGRRRRPDRRVYYQ